MKRANVIIALLVLVAAGIGYLIFRVEPVAKLAAPIGQQVSNPGAALPGFAGPLFQFGDGLYACERTDLPDGGFVLDCRPVEPSPTPAAPTRTPTSEPGTATTEPPANTPEPTPTLADTPTPEPPVVHDVNLCHGAETGDGHTHGFCADDLPEGPVKTFLLENPEFGELDHPWPSSAIENVYPWPAGKHEGFKSLFLELPECYQITNILPTPDAMCLKTLWLQVHSVQTAHASRTPGSLHSLLFVAEVCDRATFSQCNIVAGAQPTNYGEVHSQYIMTGCPGNEGGVYFPFEYSIENPDTNPQVPYVATHTRLDDFFSRPARIFWNSQVNQVLVPFLGDINKLVEVAWTENAFAVTSGDPELCHDHEHDRVWAASTDEGFKNEFVIWSFRLDLAGRPEGWSFTDRIGHPAPSCTEPGFMCIPFYKGTGLTPNQDVFYNIPVRNAFDPFVVPDGVDVIDITQLGVRMPGHVGE